MLIGKRFKIESDSLNVILFKKFKKKENEDWKVIRYYASVKSALNGLIDQGLRETEMKDLKTILLGIKDLRQMIGDALKPSTSHARASRKEKQ